MSEHGSMSSHIRQRGLITAAVDGVCRLLWWLHLATAWAIDRGVRLWSWSIAWLPWSSRLGLACIAGAALFWYLREQAADQLYAFAELTDIHRLILSRDGWDGVVDGWGALFAVMQAALGLAALLAFRRRRWSLTVLRGVLTAQLALLILAAWPMFGIPGHVYDVDPKHYDKGLRNETWLYCGWLWAIAVALAAGLVVAVWRAAPVAFFRKAAPAELPEQPGDRLVRNLRSGGEEPVFRTSLHWAVGLHVVIIFLWPVIASSCIFTPPPYDLPAGGGQAVVQVKRVQRKKPKNQRKLTFNMNSPIIIARADIDDTQVMRDVEEATQETYQATGASGQFGKGKGKGPGFAWGRGSGMVRFIRLQFNGPGWDEEMGNGADYNLLIEFNKMTQVKIAPSTESIPVAALKRYEKGRAPPFVYICGTGAVNLGSDEVRILRKYLLEDGGMLFADNAGGDFNNGFRSAMRRVVPDLDWIDISNDDPIYQEPYSFPDGAPPCWPHSGRRALGLKYNGRWIAFYHQGEIQNAWKTGNSGLDPVKTRMAYELGVNIMYYAFVQYGSLHGGEAAK
jgi:hypothetical protein